MKPATTGLLILLLPACFAIALVGLDLFALHSLSAASEKVEHAENVREYAEDIPTTVVFSEDAVVHWRKVLQDLRAGFEDRAWQNMLNDLETARVNRLQSSSADAAKFDEQIQNIRQSLIQHAAEKRRGAQQTVNDARAFLTKALFVTAGAFVALGVALCFMFKKSITDRLDGLVARAEQTADTPIKNGDPLDKLDVALQQMQRQVRESGAREKSIIENATDVICLVNTQGMFVSSNKAAKHVLGYTPEELEGHTIAEFLDPKDAEDCLKAVLAAEKSIDKVVFENRWVRKDGTIADLLWSAHWSAKDGNLFCVVHDITERVEMERWKRELSAMISHDLRAPLMSLQIILMSIEEGRFGNLNDEGVQTAARGSAEAARLISLINDLLDVEKMKAGKFSLQFEYLSMYELARAARDAVQHLADARQINIQIAEVEVFCEVDRARLMQVLVNLLSNAIKFAPAGSMVEVGISNTGGKAKVSVSDKGRGIPQEKQQLIFERFEQAEAGDGLKGGSGLGLAVCKAVIEQHKGQIGVVSTDDQGSSFWFELPQKHND